MQPQPLHSLTPYGLSRALYAVTQLQQQHPVPPALGDGLRRAVAHHFLTPLPADMEAQTVAHVLWALSKLQLYDEAVFDAAAARIPGLAPSCNVIDVSNTVHALARTYSRMADALPEGALAYLDGFMALLPPLPIPVVAVML